MAKASRSKDLSSCYTSGIPRSSPVAHEGLRPGHLAGDLALA
jgi:hypothetical protein